MFVPRGPLGGRDDVIAAGVGEPASPSERGASGGDSRQAEPHRDVDGSGEVALGFRPAPGSRDHLVVGIHRVVPLLADRRALGLDRPHVLDLVHVQDQIDHDREAL